MGPGPEKGSLSDPGDRAPSVGRGYLRDEESAVSFRQGPDGVVMKVSITVKAVSRVSTSLSVK